MSPEQAKTGVELTPETEAIASEFGDAQISFTTEENGTKTGTVREALQSCEYLRTLDGSTLRGILHAVVAAGMQEADEQA